MIAPVSDGPVNPPFSRAVPCKPARESFVFQYGSQPQSYLVISANNAYAPGPVRLQIGDIVLERVEIPSRAVTTEACRIPREQ